MEISVFNQATSQYVALAPRQELTASPFSIRTLNANAADSLSADCVGCVTDAKIFTVSGSKVTGTVANATNADNATNAATANNALNLGGTAANNYLQKSGGTITGNLLVNGVLSGNGSGLTNLPSSGGLQWQNVTSTTVQAQSYRGYIAGNDAVQVVVALPTNPSVGDTVRVTGAGAGGFSIAPNAGQTVVGAGIATPTPTTNWTPRESNRLWNSVASSSDGTKLAAVVNGGQIYTSTDTGATWMPRDTNRNWVQVVSSADGVKLATTVSGIGQVYTSLDSGATWVPHATGASFLSSIASSADGAKLAAVMQGGLIYTSTDSGATWTPRESARTWKAIASSADGSNL